jgi:anthranilate synthase/aminodeoxychorismate synthase-like glutamine amidotransferase
MLLIIDNYDSFTYNLVQYFAVLGQQVVVKRNDQLTIKEIDYYKPDYIVISPGPGTPKQAGISIEAVKQFKAKIPILGVCLGHQVIAEVFGGNIVLANKEIHGKQSTIWHNQQGIFSKISKSFLATRYHSLIVDKTTLPKSLVVTAWTQNKITSNYEIMGIKHVEYSIEGLQFHPESIASEYGMDLLQCFLTSYK